MVIIVRNPDFVASAQSDQHICSSLPVKYSRQNWPMQNYHILTVFVAKQAGLSLSWSEASQTGFNVLKHVFHQKIPCKLMNYFIWFDTLRAQD